MSVWGRIIIIGGYDFFLHNILYGTRAYKINAFIILYTHTYMRCMCLIYIKVINCIHKYHINVFYILFDTFFMLGDSVCVCVCIVVIVYKVRKFIYISSLTIHFVFFYGLSARIYFCIIVFICVENVFCF